MGNRYSTVITFGGELPHRALEELAQAIADDGPGPDWESFYGDAHGVENYLLEAATMNAPVVLCEHECNYGRMDSVERVLQQHGLAYTMDGDGDGCEIHPYREVWVPAAAIAQLGVMTETAVVEGEPATDLASLRAALAVGKTLADVIAELEYFDPKLPAFTIAPPVPGIDYADPEDTIDVGDKLVVSTQSATESAT